MAEHAIHPPIHLVTHPDEPIRSLEAAAKVIRRHAGGQRDRRAEHVLHQIKSAGTLEEAEAAGNAFQSRRSMADAPRLLAWVTRKRPAFNPALSHNAHLRSRIATIALT